MSVTWTSQGVTSYLCRGGKENGREGREEEGRGWEGRGQTVGVKVGEGKMDEKLWLVGETWEFVGTRRQV